MPGELVTGGGTECPAPPFHDRQLTQADQTHHNESTHDVFDPPIIPYASDDGPFDALHPEIKPPHIGMDIRLLS